MIRANAVRLDPTNARRPVPARARAVVLAVLALGAFLASAPTASAHAKLVSISPADGSSVAVAPKQVVITFSEELLASAVKVEVHDAEGVPVADGAPVVKGAVATQPLVGGLAAGGYSVTYRVVSKDGHPVSGSTTFTAKAAAATTTPTPTPTTPSETTSSTPPTTPATTPAGTPGTSAPAGGADDAEDGPNLLVRGVGTLLVLGVLAALALLGQRSRRR